MAATDADREAFVAVMRSYVGTPFIHAGRLPGVGLDCIGGPQCAAKDCGFLLFDMTAYPLHANGMLRVLMDTHMVKVAEPLPADVLLMKFKGQSEPHHVAVFAGLTIIHAHVHARRVVEQEYTNYWRGIVTGIYRFPELT